jgi:hypothetical protein
MIFEKPYSSIILIAICVFIIATALLFDLFNLHCSSTKEGLVDTVPIARTTNGLLLNGFYRVDDEMMAITPYGFKTDPSNETHIIPVTKVGYSMLQPRYYPALPEPGQPLPKNFYLKKVVGDVDLSLAILPPNMMPNIREVDFSGNPPSLLIYYNPGYISETQYYKNKYKPNTTPNPGFLPKELYFVDSSKTKVAFLQYGEIQDEKTGYGKIMNPALDLKMKDFNYKTSNYRDISNNYDMQFHDDIETIKKQNNLYDLSYGEVRVRDQNGNIIILPKVDSQNSVTYYQPGEFRFGSSKYVPNYEDSIYLSQITRKTMYGNTQAGECNAACMAYNEFKSKMDKFYS